MSLPYFLTADPTSGRLNGPEGRHAVTVKRIAQGERIVLSDGAGLLATVNVTEVIGKDGVVGDVVDIRQVPRPTPTVTVVQAIPKSDRAELAVDLATQGGADAIIPWVSHRTIARWQGPKVAKNREKWRATAREAAKQSRRAWVPDVLEPVTTPQLAALLQNETATRLPLVLHEDAAKGIAAVDFRGVQEVFLIVGPEGGIGEEELADLHATPIKLGPDVLRTASAALAGLSAIGVLTARW